jgi:hypothetical protein
VPLRVSYRGGLDETRGPLDRSDKYPLNLLRGEPVVEATHHEGDVGRPCALTVFDELDPPLLGGVLLDQTLHRRGIGGTAEESPVPGLRRCEVADRYLRQDLLDSHSLSSRPSSDMPSLRGRPGFYHRKLRRTLLRRTS